MKPKRKSLIAAAFFLYIMAKDKPQGKKKSCCVGGVCSKFPTKLPANNSLLKCVALNIVKGDLLMQ